MTKFVIEIDDEKPGKAQVYVNDNELKYVTGIYVDADADGQPEVVIEKAKLDHGVILHEDKQLITEKIMSKYSALKEDPKYRSFKDAISDMQI